MEERMTARAAIVVALCSLAACTPQLAATPSCNPGEVLASAPDGGWVCAAIGGSVDLTEVHAELQALDASVQLATAGFAALPAASTNDLPRTLVLRNDSGTFTAHTVALDESLVLLDGGIFEGAGRAQIVQVDLVDRNFFAGVGAAVPVPTDGNLDGAGSNDTALGVGALAVDVTGGRNVAVGALALAANQTASDNTAVGFESLNQTVTGNNNTAVGSSALSANTASFNTAVGALAMNLLVGSYNTAVGANAIQGIGAGAGNVAVGANSLQAGVNNNTALGYGALGAASGSENIGLGHNGGAAIGAGDFNIEIGTPGVSGDAHTLRVGAAASIAQTYIAGIVGQPAPSGIAVMIGADGKLGTTNSSAIYKTDIHDMGAASAVLLELRPVSFKYKPEYDDAGTQQYGLIAEEVERVAPELVVHGADGKLLTVRYDQVNAMLLNEVQRLRVENDAQRAALKQIQARLKAIEARIH
jgi:hypothetical protein